MTFDAAPNSNSATRRQRLRTTLRRSLPFAVGVLATLVGLILYNRLFPPPAPLTPRDVDDSVTEALAAATPAPAYSATVYQQILPSLVVIQTQQGDPGGDGIARGDDGSLLLRRQVNHIGYTVFYPLPASPIMGEEPLWDRRRNSSLPRMGRAGEGSSAQQPVPPNLASGVVINAEGAILTALHVVERAGSIDLIFADGTQTTGELVGAQPDNDIAVLQADELPETFAPATLGNPNALRVGDEAYVVGNPLGLAGSLSAGVVSGFDRTYAPQNFNFELTRLIQFDAAVNPGSAGGPLLNRNGEVVGVVVGVVNPLDQVDFSGIGLAVRIDQAGQAVGAPPR